MTEMETPTTPAPRSPWLPAIICSAVVGLALAGCLYSMREDVIAEFKANASKQADERSKLAARVDAMQSSLDTISGQPKPDADALNAQLTEVTSKLAAVNDRLTTLEKKPEPAPTPSPPAPKATAEDDSAVLKLAATSGKPFSAELTAWEKLNPKTDAQVIAPLAAVAQTGIPSEAEMNGRLRVALDDAMHSKRIDDVSLIGKINTHLAGLVSIKKSTDASPYTKLRADVMRDDTATLTASVEKLSDADRQPLEDWLTAAHARRDALRALNILVEAEAK